MSADTGELDRVAEQLGALRDSVMRAMRPVVSKGALNIKTDWRANAAVSAGAHGRLYPSSITYDLTVSANDIEAVIGPDKAGPQGFLGPILEYGSVNNPPHNDGGRALDAEDGRFVAAVEAAAEAAVLP